MREKIKNFFMSQPMAPVIFQLSSSYLSGIHMSVKERKIKQLTVLSLPPGLLEPHFDRQNLKDTASLAEVIREGLKRLHYAGEKIACLIPESCFKIFVFSFESLPSLEREREKLIRWRVKKQLPSLPEDIRLSYETRKLNGSLRVLASLGRTAVLKEYEDLFAGLGGKVGILTASTFSLLNLIDWEKDKDSLVVNIEEDSMSLVVISDGEISLYRSKPFAVDRPGVLPQGEGIGNIIKEIENTVHSIEDREKRRIGALWLRSGLGALEKDIANELRSRLLFPVRLVDVPLLAEVSAVEKAILAPLVGQAL